MKLFELLYFQIIKCIYNRPNIFYDVLDINHPSELSEITDFVVSLVNVYAKSPEDQKRLLIYANKDIATRLTVQLGVAFGQFDMKVNVEANCGLTYILQVHQRSANSPFYSALWTLTR